MESFWPRNGTTNNAMSVIPNPLSIIRLSLPYCHPLTQYCRSSTTLLSLTQLHSLPATITQKLAILLTPQLNRSTSDISSYAR
jgi:hypothetical protein